jgi:tetratricopeptide (TPR) repeat protein
MRRLFSAASLVLLAGASWAAGRAAAPAATPADVERRAAAARLLRASDPEAALRAARAALAETSEFVPTAFVSAGRKGELVEDAYVAARAAYRQHRARLYQAVGECLVSAGRPLDGGRYLQRAHTLDPQAGALGALADAWLSAGRGFEALDLLLAGVREGTWSTEARAAAERSADVLGLASLQSEIDRVRLAAQQPKARFQLGPALLPERARLSTGASLRLDEPGLTLLYIAERSCRTCSADVDTLQRTLPREARVLATGDEPNDDYALRQALRLYRRDWPIVSGPRLAPALGVSAPALLLFARSGFTQVALTPPFERSLPEALAVLQREDVVETRPRAQWNRRPPVRPPARPTQGLLAEGLALGEDLPAPAAFDEAVAAFTAGRYEQALRLFERLEQAGDGWLLTPEARFNRALCLARLGRHAEARALLLRTGDSRVQAAVDAALDGIGGGR